MKILILVVLFCGVVFGEDGSIAVKSNQPDTIVQVRKTPGKDEWVDVGVTDKNGSYLLVKLPIGKQEIKLFKDGFAPLIAVVNVDRKINKVEFNLESFLMYVDVVFLVEGWQIYVDKVPYLDSGGKPVFAPTTIILTKQKHEVRLVKGGFNDIIKNVDVNKVVGNDSNYVVEFKDKPVEGRSTIVKKEIKKEEPKKEEEEKLSKDKSVSWAIGKWKTPVEVFQINYENNNYILRLIGSHHRSLDYMIVNHNLLFKWSNGNDIIVIVKDGKDIIIKDYGHYLDNYNFGLPDTKMPTIWSYKVKSN